MSWAPITVTMAPDTGAAESVTVPLMANVAMASCKAIADAGHAVGAESSIATAMARNGVTFGVRLGATGDRWFTAQEALEYGFVDHIITSVTINGDGPGAGLDK